jgi:hypothetical protein
MKIEECKQRCSVRRTAIQSGAFEYCNVLQVPRHIIFTGNQRLNISLLHCREGAPYQRGPPIYARNSLTARLIGPELKLMKRRLRYADQRMNRCGKLTARTNCRLHNILITTFSVVCSRSVGRHIDQTLPTAESSVIEIKRSNDNKLFPSNLTRCGFCIMRHTRSMLC